MSSHEVEKTHIAKVLAEHRHPGELLTVFGEAWLVCGCGQKIDLPVVNNRVNIDGASNLYEAHVAEHVGTALRAAGLAGCMGGQCLLTIRAVEVDMSDAYLEDDEEFCPDCFAGITSPQHLVECAGGDDA